MKKIIALVATLILAIGCLFGLVGCDDQKYVALAITGIENEEYGYCINKNADDHDKVLKAINDVINETDIDVAIAYYTAVAKDEEPTVELEFPNLNDNTAGTLKIYTHSGFEPYEFIGQDGSTVVGVDMYMMQLVCEKLNKKMEINDVDFTAIFGKVETEKDAIGAAGITIRPDRVATADYSNPYYSSVQYLISKEDEGFTSLDQVKGKKIGVQTGTTGYLYVEDALKNGVLKDTGAEMSDYKTGAVAFEALKKGKIDYVVIDKLPALKLVG